MDTDNDTQDGKDEQQHRQEENVNRLVRLAKQQQNVLAAWLAASKYGNTESITLSLPKRNMRQVMSDAPLEGPIDVDSGEEWADEATIQSGLTVGNGVCLGGSSKRFFHSATTAANNSQQTRSVGPPKPRKEKRAMTRRNSKLSTHSDHSEETKVASNASKRIDLETGRSLDAVTEDSERAFMYTKRTRTAVVLMLALIMLIVLVTVTISAAFAMKGSAKAPSSGMESNIDRSPTTSPTTKTPTTTGNHHLLSAPTVRPSPTSPTSQFPTRIRQTTDPTFDPTASSDSRSTTPSSMSQVPTKSPSLFPSTSFSTTTVSQVGDAWDGEGWTTTMSSSNGTAVCTGGGGSVECREWINSTWVPQPFAGGWNGTAGSLVHNVVLSASGQRLVVSGDSRVMIFDWILQSWRQQDQEFPGYSVALNQDGTRLAIGSPADNTVRVLDYNGNRWVQIGGSLQGSTHLDGFGYDLDLSEDGNLLAVGAPRNPDYRGYVGLYQWDAGRWKVEAQILNAEGVVQEGDRFGMSVSVSSGRVAIGAPRKESGKQENCGMVLVYQKQLGGSAWTLAGRPLTGSGPYHGMGRSVDLAGDYMVVGHPGAASVSLHRWTGQVWDTASSHVREESVRDFGFSVSISQDGYYFAASAPASNSTGSAGGYVRVMKR